MLTIDDVEKLLDPSILEGDCQLQLSKVHRCLIMGITDDQCALCVFRGLPHVVLYIFKLVEDFTATLRNINYVRSKVAGQKLLGEYAEALKYTSGETKVALQHWLKFVNIYGPFMMKNSFSSHSLAINQVSSSYVYMDTKEWVGKSVEKSPLYWLNRPHELNDCVLMRYANGDLSMSCAATSVTGNMIAFSVEDHVLVYQMNTGILLYQLDIQSMHNLEYAIFNPCLAFGNDDTELLVACASRGLLVYDAKTGILKWSYELNMQIFLEGEDTSDWIVWQQYVGECIVLGTYGGSVLFILPSSHVPNDTWTLGEDAATYCYHPSRHWLLSGHQTQKVMCWTMDGTLMKTLQVEGEVVDMAVHPASDEIIACTVRCGNERHGRRQDKHIQLNVETAVVVSTVEETKNVFYECRSFLGYIFHHGNVRLVCTCKEWILVCDEECHVVNSVGRFEEEISEICLVPNSNYVLATGEHDCYLYDLGGLCDDRIQDIIECCSFLRGVDHFITLSCDGELQKWSTKNFERTPLVRKDSSYRFMTTHPFQDVVFLWTEEKLLILEPKQFQTVSEYIIQGAYGDARDAVVSEDGEKLVVVWDSGTSVYDISDLSNIHLICKNEVEQNMAADIHRDSEQVVSMGAGGTQLWRISTLLEEGSTALTGSSGQYVRFMYDPDCIVCVTGTDVLLLNLDGTFIRTIKVGIASEAHLVNNTHLITGDDFIQLTDLCSGERCGSVFYHHPSICFNLFAISPDLTMVIAGNLDGKLYAFNLCPAEVGESSYITSFSKQISSIMY